MSEDTQADQIAARVCPCQHRGGPLGKATHDPAWKVECAHTLDIVAAALAEASR